MITKAAEYGRNLVAKTLEKNKVVYIKILC